MRIALVIERMDPGRGGREMATAEIAVELARREQEVTIICQEADWSGQGVAIRRLGRRGLGRMGQLRNFVADVQREISRAGYDIVQAMLPLPGANVYQPHGGTVPAQRISRIRKHGPLGRINATISEFFKPQRRLMRMLEKQVVQDSETLILAVSQMIQREFGDYYKRQDGIKVIYNGVDVPQIPDAEKEQWRKRKRAELKVEADEILFLVVANNFALKGVAEAITAFGRWLGQRGERIGARLVVVGNGKPGRYRPQVKREGIGEQVIFAGPTEQIFQWYAAADACILLSWYDPCSRVVLEAARWGLPSITTAYNGAAEIVADGAVAVSSPGDIDAVVAGLEELADAEKRSQRAKGCLRIADRISIEHHVEQLVAVYAEIKKGAKRQMTKQPVKWRAFTRY